MVMWINACLYFKEWVCTLFEASDSVLLKRARSVAGFLCTTGIVIIVIVWLLPGDQYEVGFWGLILFLAGAGLIEASEKKDDPEARVAGFSLGTGIALAGFVIMKTYIVDPLLGMFMFLMGFSLASANLMEPKDRKCRCYCDP